MTTLVARLVGSVAAVMLLAGCMSAEDVLFADDGGTSSEPAGDTSRGLGDGPEGSGLDRFYEQEVEWTDCDDDRQCAEVWVPLDYADPDGQAVTVQAERQQAGSDADRQGSLFINPGGPGGSGIDMLDFFVFGDDVEAAYDIVGFDPRGVARSTPVHCIDDAEKDALNAADPTPDDPAEVATFRELFAGFRAGCAERSPEMVGHMSTVEVARDLDILRAVVDDDVLNFYGASYGTAIGATYAGLFPDLVGAMVLDGAVDLSDVGPASGSEGGRLDPRDSTGLQQAVGFDEALTAYLEDCVTSDDCPVGDDVDAGRERIIDLLDEADAAPLPTGTDRPLTEGLLFTGLVLPLYDEMSWSVLTQALDDALDGDGSTFLYLADTYAGRNDDGTYDDNSLDAQSAVNCLDSPSSATIPQIKASGPVYAKEAPVFGPAAQWWPYTCTDWPATAAEPPPDFSAPGAEPIVVIGTTGDPATPYHQAKAMAETLESGVLLTREGDGHTAYMSGNDCISDAVDTFLVDGTPPDDGTTC